MTYILWTVYNCVLDSFILLEEGLTHFMCSKARNLTFETNFVSVSDWPLFWAFDHLFSSPSMSGKRSDSDTDSVLIHEKQSEND